MRNNFLYQLWVACKIWLLAVMANTFLGSAWLTGFFSDTGWLTDLLIFGSVLGALYSFPVFLILLIIINRCVARKLNGLVLFRIVFLSGVALATIASFVFFTLGNMGLRDSNFSLQFITVLSAMIAIAAQHGALYRLATYNNHFKDYLA